MADEGTGLGRLIDGHRNRDAVHNAITPVTADQNLMPGSKVVLVGSEHVRAATGTEEWDGVIDPFLTVPVLRGQRCWLWMKPGSITSLRHDWEHPAFKREAMTNSQQWLSDFADRNDHSLEEVMDAAESGYIGGDPGVEVPDEFWEHYERVTGAPVPAKKRSSYFSCSC